MIACMCPHDYVPPRYQQKRRHMQGIAELSYLLLQHYTIASTSKERLPYTVHGHFFALLLKLF